jgi:hypothetical protein
MDKWEEIEKRLEEGIFSDVKIRIGNDRVTFRNQLFERKLRIITYVNGEIMGILWKVDADGRPAYRQGQYFRPIKKRTFPKKEYKRLVYILGKEKADKLTSLRICALSPIWNSARSLIQHLKKNFPNLEIIREEDEGANDVEK